MEGTLSTNVLSQLPADCQKRIEGYAKAIDKEKAKGVACILAIGKQLADAQDAMSQHGNGTFCLWMKERCRLSKSSGYNYINAHKVFGEKVCPTIGQTIDANALYYLSKDTTPEEAIEAAVEQAEAGERITLKKAKELVAQCEEIVKEADGDDEPDESDELPDYVKRLQPYESLTEAIESLNAAVAAVYLRWPQEYMVALSDRLQSLAEELQEKGTLRC